MSKVIVHRDVLGVPGEEHLMSETCWCEPIIVDAEAERTTDEIIEQSNRPIRGH